jgi:hypothetical protein
MSGKEIELTPEAARVLVAMADTADMDYINEKQLTRQLKMSVKEVRHHLKVLAAFGLVQEAGEMTNHDPIRDADTNPDTWLHAPNLFEPLAVSQCYPHVFMTLLKDLEDTGADLTRVLSDDNWLDFLTTHVGIIKCEPPDALKFFATEIIEQMLRRINERYPVTKGYSPAHIALVAVYRAMRAAHDKVDKEGTP